MAASQPTPQGEQLQPVAARPQRDPRRILVVEPQASTRGLMQFSLVRAGFHVASVRSAEEADRALEEGPQPAVVVSEVRLPGLDGFAFCARLRRSSASELPVKLTGQPSERAASQAASVGADDYLAKPLFAGDLATLARLESSRSPGSPTLVASTREVPVAAALRALLAGTRSGRLVLGTQRALFRPGPSSRPGAALRGSGRRGGCCCWRGRVRGAPGPVGPGRTWRWTSGALRSLDGRPRARAR
jgi:CheY-like chemotaxis protein